MTNHYSFDYDFTETLGIEFAEIYFYKYDLLIYYGDETEDYIDCRCSRWSIDDDNIIIETFLSKSDYQRLQNNCVPGAVEKSYNVLGKNYYYDSTFGSNNTLVFTPNSNPTHMPNSTLSEMKSVVTGYVSNLTSYDVTEDYVGVIIESKMGS